MATAIFNNCFWNVVGLLLLTCAVYSADYCEQEEAILVCGPGEVIMMESAIYGRMKEGKCISLALQGTMGCSEDILDVLDTMCSGRQICQFVVLAHKLNRKNVCHQELAKYLETTYKCFQAMTPEHKCSTQVISVHTGLTNLVNVPNTECVSETWQLEAEPGQQLTINIIDFAWNKLNNVTCPALYGHVINPLTNQRTPVCGQGQRIKSIYTSDHHVLQLELKKTNNYFIIQVTVRGCPDVVAPPGAWVRRQDNEVLIGCKQDDKTWTLKCDNDRWIGIIGNCTTSIPAEEKSVVRDKYKPDVKEPTERRNRPLISERTAILIMICITVVLCVTVITIGIVCIGRYKARMPMKHPKNNPEPDYVVYDDLRGTTLPLNNSWINTQKNAMPSGASLI